MKTRSILGLGAVLVSLPWSATAAEAPQAMVGNEAPVTLTYPVKFAATPIAVDGRLQPEEWDQAVKVAGFRLSGREDLASEQTVMRLLYDARHLYIAVKCAESQMDKLVVNCLVDDTDVWKDDCVEFFIDPTHDHATYYQFIVNAGAVRYDAVGFDRTWGAPWQAAASREKDAWYLELAIPFAALAVPAPAPGSVWGFNLDRERNAGGNTQLYNWADVQGVFHSPTRFGHLWFVAPNAGPDERGAQDAASKADGREARVYTPDGYWLIAEGAKPKAWSYRDLLLAQKDTVAGYWDALATIYREHPTMVYRDRFEQFRRRYEDARQLATAQGPVDPEACAAAKVFLDTLDDALNLLYWKARIELLNESF